MICVLMLIILLLSLICHKRYRRQKILESRQRLTKEERDTRRNEACGNLRNHQPLLETNALTFHSEIESHPVFGNNRNVEGQLPPTQRYFGNFSSANFYLPEISCDEPLDLSTNNEALPQRAIATNTADGYGNAFQSATNTAIRDGNVLQSATNTAIGDGNATNTAIGDENVFHPQTNTAIRGGHFLQPATNTAVRERHDLLPDINSVVPKRNVYEPLDLSCANLCGSQIPQYPAISERGDHESKNVPNVSLCEPQSQTNPRGNGDEPATLEKVSAMAQSRLRNRNGGTVHTPAIDISSQVAFLETKKKKQTKKKRK